MICAACSGNKIDAAILYVCRDCLTDWTGDDNDYKALILKIESLERKLAIAVKTLTAISDHWVDYELGEMTHEGRAAKEALEKIKGEK